MRQSQLLLTLYFGFTFCQNTFGQYLSPQWATAWENPSPASENIPLNQAGISDFSILPNGNIASLGTTYFYPQNNTTSVPQTSVTLYDTEGNTIWNNYFEGNILATAIATDQFGNILIAGNMQGEVNFTPEDSYIDFEFYHELSAAFVLKLNNQGDPMWIRKWLVAANAPSYSEYHISHMEINASNEIIIGGHNSGSTYFESIPEFNFENLNGSNNTFLAKLDYLGYINWHLTYPNMGMYTLDLNIQSNQDIIVTHVGSIHRVSSEASPIWTKQFESSAGLFPQSLSCPIATDQNGDIYFAFESWSNGIIMYNSSELPISNLNEDYSYNILVKVNALGELIWAKPFQAIDYNNSYHDNGIDIRDLEIIDEKLVVFLNHAGTLDVDPSEAILNMQGGEFINKNLLVFLNSEGELFEATELPGIWGFCSSNNLEPYDDGSLISVQSCSPGLNNFNPYTGPPFELFQDEETSVLVKYQVGSIDPFLASLSVDNSIVLSENTTESLVEPSEPIVLLSNVPENDFIQVYPNPSRGIFVLSHEIKDFVVLNIQGQEIFKSTQLTRMIDLTAFPHGVYILKNNSGSCTRLVKSQQ